MKGGSSFLVHWVCYNKADDKFGIECLFWRHDCSGKGCSIIRTHAVVLAIRKGWFNIEQKLDLQELEEELVTLGQGL